jgi:hypothetical protein
MAMLRVFKHYEFNFQMDGVAGRKLSFSSYPGARRRGRCVNTLCKQRQSRAAAAAPLPARPPASLF